MNDIQESNDIQEHFSQQYGSLKEKHQISLLPSHSWFERRFHYASQYSELLCVMLVCLFGLWVLLKDTPILQYIVVWYVTPRLASAELQLPSWAGNNSVSLAIRFPGIDARTSKLVMLGRTSALGFWKWETLIITDSGGQENGCRWPVPFLVLLLHVL